MTITAEELDARGSKQGLEQGLEPAIEPEPAHGDAPSPEHGPEQRSEHGPQPGCEPAHAPGREQGLQQGLTRGRRQTLEKLMVAKFGPLPEHVTARLDAADLELLDCWLEGIFTADTAEAVVESSIDG